MALALTLAQKCDQPWRTYCVPSLMPRQDFWHRTGGKASEQEQSQAQPSPAKPSKGKEREKEGFTVPFLFFLIPPACPATQTPSPARSVSYLVWQCVTTWMDRS